MTSINFTVIFLFTTGLSIMGVLLLIMRSFTSAAIMLSLAVGLGLAIRTSFGISVMAILITFLAVFWLEFDGRKKGMWEE